MGRARFAFLRRRAVRAIFFQQHSSIHHSLVLLGLTGCPSKKTCIINLSLPSQLPNNNLSVFYCSPEWDVNIGRFLVLVGSVIIDWNLIHGLRGFNIFIPFRDQIKTFQTLHVQYGSQQMNLGSRYIRSPFYHK